jgi:UrcA family protein
MYTRHFAIAVVAAIAAASASTSAQALSSTERRTEAVEFADLDLSRLDDGALLHERIIEAADRICTRPWPRTVIHGADRRRCFHSAVQGAVDRLDEESLTLAHQRRFDWADDRNPRVSIRVAYR